MKYVFIIMALLLALPNFIDRDINGVPVYNGMERFSPTLSSINSTDKLEMYIDGCAAMENIEVGTGQYDSLVANIISRRFYHGFSHFSLSENWIAALSEKMFGYGLASKVQPNEIMQHPYAACSQQALVMMEILRRKNINYRKVGFPHHYALEVMVNKNWYYFDPNMEPKIALTKRTREQWQGKNDNLKQYYDTTKYNDLAYQFGNGQIAEVGNVNEIPASNAKLFQGVTAFASKVLWCIPLLGLLKRKRQPFMYVVKPDNRYQRFKNLTTLSRLKYYF